MVEGVSSVSSNSHLITDPRIREALDVIFEYALGNLQARGRISEQNDNIDALITGINMLGEELEAYIAQRKQVEEDIAKLNENLQRQIMELEEARILAGVGIKARGEFLANMSHELSTPLNAIIGFSQVLLEDPNEALSEQQREYIQIILQSGQRLNKTYEAILQVTGLESGEMKLMVKPFLIKDLLQSSLLAFNERAALQGISLDLKMDFPPGTEVEADHRLLQQVMSYLLDNAVKFTHAGGSVRVHARLTEDEGAGTSDEGRAGGDETLSFTPASETKGHPSSIVISVTDTGIGINEEDMTRLFQPFYQLESPYSKKYRGTGAGLFLAKGLIEIHGGRIWAKSKPGSGSTFTFILPIRHTSPYPQEKDKE
ncbi:MAG: HAMP domain-containing histidine kinase [Proteobacteria bacterium]|nr:HAMP domain-containing histidine kinase [Pseudomonadota bacterium]MBU1649220.1 HAMP domain-containing histidine kinase [Pseudomonadota bacterium]